MVPVLLAETATRVAGPPAPRRPPSTLRAGGLLIALGVLVLVALLSIAVGAKAIPLGTVIHELCHYDGSDNGVIIRGLRVPRTLIGLAVGAALGLGGALMQGLTRNPLADPGILGINAGAAAAIVTAIAALGLRTPGSYVWFGLVGAGVAAVIVYALGSRGRSAATPVRLALAGAAVTAVLQSFVSGLTLLDTTAFNDYRFWTVGSLATEPLSILAATGPFLLVGLVLAACLARPLNALALGEDTGRALGAHLGRTRAVGMLAVTLLCGAATATVGPIAFVGLTVPHVARAITGPDQRWVLPYSALLAPILLLGSDIVGRLVARPGEIQVGIVTAFVGAHVFIAIARRRRMAQL